MKTAEIITYEEYHPFGTSSYRSGSTETEVSLKRYKYVFKELDNESGLYYYGMRYYAAPLARFVSVDPLQFKYPFYTPFQYAGNKPVSFIDLDGAEEVAKALKDRSDNEKVKEPEKNNNKSQQTKKYTFEEYVNIWEYNHGDKMSNLQKDILSAGCIGITQLELGRNYDKGKKAPPTDFAYSSFERAMKGKKEVEKLLKIFPEGDKARVIMFAIKFWTDSPDTKFLSDSDGKVNMDNWDPENRKPGRRSDGWGYPNFDFGLYDEKSKTWWDANQGQTDEVDMIIKEKSLKEFKKLGENYNKIVYCIAVTCISKNN